MPAGIYWSLVHPASKSHHIVAGGCNIGNSTVIITIISVSPLGFPLQACHEDPNMFPLCDWLDHNEYTSYYYCLYLKLFLNIDHQYVHHDYHAHHILD